MKTSFFIRHYFVFIIWFLTSVEVFGYSSNITYYESRIIRNKVLSKGKIIKQESRTITNDGDYLKTPLKSIKNAFVNKSKVSVKAIPPPLHTVSGGGSYCSGKGLPIYLDGSDKGISYQLKLNDIDLADSPISGTGQKLTFPLQTSQGDYTVVATDTITKETALMKGKASISSYSIQKFKMEGGGSYCEGRAGKNISLVSSLKGYAYQLKFKEKNGNTTTDIGKPKQGTDEKLDFGEYIQEGTYIVVATSNDNSSCSDTMEGSVTITIDTPPKSYRVTGTGSFCENENGLPITLDGSQTGGVFYRLKRNDQEISDLHSIQGTGKPLKFPPQKEDGEYTIVAKNTSGCEKKMEGSAILKGYPLPTEYSINEINSGGSYCAGNEDNATLSVYLSNSEENVTYQLMLKNSDDDSSKPEGSPIQGKGGMPLTFNGLKKPGIYTIRATSNNGCIRQMKGSSTITVNKLPKVFKLSGGGSYCEGKEIFLTLSHSEENTLYFLKKGESFTDIYLKGTGNSLNFQIKTSGKDSSPKEVYSITAINDNGCISDMEGNTEITIVPLPTIFTVSGGGTYCKEASVTLSNSQKNVKYQLQKNGNNVGDLIAGTGEKLVFPSITESGIYRVTAINNTANCEIPMNVQANMIINKPPEAFTVSGGGLYCRNKPDLSVTLSNSQSGVKYQLQRNGYKVGDPIAGKTGEKLTFTALTDEGLYTIIATDDRTACTSEMIGNAAITFGLPITISGKNVVCIKEETVYTTKSGMKDYNWSVEGGTIIEGGKNNDDFTKVLWDKKGKGTVNVSYTDNETCDTNTVGTLDVIIDNCNLSISIEASNYNPFISDIITFTIKTKNIGNAAFSDITIKENLPTGFEFISPTVSQGTYNPTSEIWNIPTLAGNETATLTINTKVLNNDDNIYYIDSVDIKSSKPVNLSNNHAEIKITPIFLTIYNVFSPNGDGINDFFIIDHIENFPNNTLKVHNRYGQLVYSAKGYRNDWDGIDNVGNTIGGNKKLPDGTYFYILNLGPGIKEKTGWIQIQN